MNLEIPDFIECFTITSRRADITYIPRFEVHVRHIPFRDQFDRGCGDVWGHGYSSNSEQEALDAALANLLAAKQARLEDCNARPQYLSTALGPATLSGAFADITLDL